MKPVNLLSLVNAKKDLESSVFNLFKSKLDISIKENEMVDIESLVNQFRIHSKELDILDGFYIGYTINQISKEFDLLRFGKNSVINIELKRENTGERIRKQLIKNKYYLSFLGKKVYSFTYVVNDNKLFYLNESEIITETDFPFLIFKLNDQIFEYIEDIDTLFNPSNYLVSPFNSTEAFITGRYFLTIHQETIKNQILHLSTEAGPCFISIQGSAGTGKTLLTYDIAKEYINNSKNVLIFHCGSLNNGHKKLIEDYSWSITKSKNFQSYNLSQYDLIIIDEAQRISKDDLENILTNIKNTNAKCIFSYDYQQCLASWEINNNIPQYIAEKVSPHSIFKLTEKIRTNMEIGSFIKNLFDLSKKNPNQKYCNVNVQYFSNASDAKEFIKMLKNQGWKAINYTPSKYTRYPYDYYEIMYEDSAHEVIGQEYDNVIAVLDQYFYYNESGKLSTKGWPSKPYYHPTKMLFQIVSRTRKKLCLIIIKNEAVLNQILKILHNK
ncbi:ATP-binding protein [Neobacillus sp.]|uniref:ATP-binding protein n=1 Tax=Neobacillus sp. TaxID=2675273 RepID=UPI0035B559E0